MEGSICPYCRIENKPKRTIKEKTESFIKRCKERWGDKFKYDNTIFIDYDTPTKVICDIHGEIEVIPKHFLYDSNVGCYECSIDAQRKNLNDFINEANKIHNFKYDYSKYVYVNNKTNGIIICPIHGEFQKSPQAHIHQKQGCQNCSRIETNIKLSDTKEQFIEKAIKMYGEGAFDFSKVEYINSKHNVTLICKKCGKEFDILPNNLLMEHGCSKCANSVSNWEKEINEYINSIGFETETSNRKILEGKEIDILVKNSNIGFECDGLIYHSEFRNKDKNYHLEKTKLARTKGIYLIHIFEDEWYFKKEIVKSMISNVLHKTQNKIHARKCELKIVNNDDKCDFLNQNHIQGDVNSNINLGLYFNDELVSLMTFGKLRKNLGSSPKEGSYELLRFCNKLNTTVVGGASKLFKYFTKNYNFNDIKSYCDLRWYRGNMYEMLGFEYNHSSAPNYFYINNRHRENRFNYRKDVLVKQGFDANKSEHEIMLERKIYRIYDCGCKVYTFVKKC